MNNINNKSVAKLDNQIKKLVNNQSKEDDKTPILNKKELNRKIKLEKLDKEIEQNRKKKGIKNSSNENTSIIDMDEISKKYELEKEDELRKIYSENKPIVKIKRNYRNSKLKKNYQNKKNQISEALDDQYKVDKIVKLLSYIFFALLTIFIIAIGLICTIKH